MFTEEWHSLDWEVSPRQSMKSVVLEMSVLFRVASFLSFLLSAYFMKPLFNLVVVPSVEMSWVEDGGEKRKKKNSRIGMGGKRVGHEGKSGT